MTTPLLAEIVTTGTEILLGDIVDTNAAWIAQQLRETGVNLFYKTTVGDNLERVRGVIEQGLGRSHIIIVTGGLGPTVDDITRDAIAVACERKLVLYEQALETLKLRFARFQSPMTENNLRQVYLPEASILIENPVGTAPGFIVETERCAVIALPGVPREMKRMMAESVLPWIRLRAGEGILRRRILRTFGIGESTIDVRLDDLMHLANSTVGLAAHTGQCDIRIAARAANAEEAESMLDGIEEIITGRLGGYIYTKTPGEAFEEVLARRLHAAGVRVALAEQHTNGALGRRLGGPLPEQSPVHAEVHFDLPPDANLTAAVEQEARSLAARCPQAVCLALAGTTGSDEGIFESRTGASMLAILPPEGELKLVTIPYGGTEEYTIIRICNIALLELARLLPAPEPAGVPR